MADAIVGVFTKGFKDWDKATTEIERNVDKATLGALRENQRILKAAVRKNLSGRPRWTQRGASRATGEAVKVEGPRHSPRDGGPGQLTGLLRKGVGGVRRPRHMGNDLVGGVGVKGSPVNNFKKRTLEAKYPYFRPAVEATEPKMAAAFNKGWDKAINKMGGIL
jgi:hypothetical protein